MTFAERFGGGRALVTGGGDGIGRAFARAMTAAGLKVAVLDIRQDAAAAVAAELGEGSLALGADVSDREALAAAAEAVQAAWGGLEVLWINAGVGVGSPLTIGSPRTVEWAVSVNILGVAWTAQVFLPLLKAGSGERAVGVTASTAALSSPSGPRSLYAATKHATLAFGEAIRAELAPEGIGTTLFCPGLLSTDIWDAARARPERFGGVRRMDPAVSTRWREAQAPDRAVNLALSVMADGGGYCVVPTEDGTLAEVEARFEAIRAGVR
jgi:NAD(P)-dependent dehydrogenase (short-subunit alcohol dehydrogenase family)